MHVGPMKSELDLHVSVGAYCFTYWNELELVV